MIINRKLLIFSLLILLLSFSLHAQIYYYRDNKNNLIYTNVPKNSEARILQGSFNLKYSFVRQEFGRRYGRLLDSLCSQWKIEKKLVEAVIEAESNFNPWVVSRKGARGLMQLMPQTAKRYGVKNIFDAQQNLTAGIRHLKYLLQTYNNNLDLALAAYNAGNEAVSKYGGIPPYRETRNYINKVKKLYSGNRLAYTPSYNSNKRSPPVRRPIYQYLDKEGKPHFTNLTPVNKSLQVIKLQE